MFTSVYVLSVLSHSTISPTTINMISTYDDVVGVGGRTIQAKIIFKNDGDSINSLTTTLQKEV